MPRWFKTEVREDMGYHSEKQRVNKYLYIYLLEPHFGDYTGGVFAVSIS